MYSHNGKTDLLRYYDCLGESISFYICRCLSLCLSVSLRLCLTLVYFIFAFNSFRILFWFLSAFAVSQGEPANGFEPPAPSSGTRRESNFNSALAVAKITHKTVKDKVKHRKPLLEFFKVGWARLYTTPYMSCRVYFPG